MFSFPTPQHYTSFELPQHFSLILLVIRYILREPWNDNYNASEITCRANVFPAVLTSKLCCFVSKATNCTPCFLHHRSKTDCFYFLQIMKGKPCPLINSYECMNVQIKKAYYRPAAREEGWSWGQNIPPWPETLKKIRDQFMAYSACSVC